MKLQNKVAIVTGAAGGMGNRCATDRRPRLDVALRSDDQRMCQRRPHLDPLTGGR